MTRNVDKENLNKIAARYHLSPQISDKQFDHKFHDPLYAVGG